MCKALGLIPSSRTGKKQRSPPLIPSRLDCTYLQSQHSVEAEAGRLWVWGHLGLHSKCEASLGYTETAWLKKEKYVDPDNILPSRYKKYKQYSAWKLSHSTWEAVSKMFVVQAWEPEFKVQNPEKASHGGTWCQSQFWGGRDRGRLAGQSICYMSIKPVKGSALKH